MYFCHSVVPMQAVSFDRCLLVGRMAGSAGTPTKHQSAAARSDLAGERTAIALPH